MSTIYSKDVKGKKYNFDLVVSFDLTDGNCLGIEQEKAVGNVGCSIERVLLSENQVIALLKFLRENGSSTITKLLRSSK